MSKAIAKMFEPMFAAFAKRYQGWVGAELSKYGLRYDDLLDETMNLDVAEALKRLPQEERDLRMQRLKRAMDLSLKHVYLDPEMQKKQTPFKWYVRPSWRRSRRSATSAPRWARGSRTTARFRNRSRPPSSTPSEAHLSGPTNRAPRAVVIIALHSSIHARVRVRIVRVDHASRSVEPIAPAAALLRIPRRVARDFSSLTTPRRVLWPRRTSVRSTSPPRRSFRVSRLVRASIRRDAVDDGGGGEPGARPRRRGSSAYTPVTFAAASGSSPSPSSSVASPSAPTRTRAYSDSSPPPTFHGSSATTTATWNVARRSRVTRPGAPMITSSACRHAITPSARSCALSTGCLPAARAPRVLVHAHDEKIAERAGAFEESNVTRVKKVEGAVRVHHARAGGGALPPPLNCVTRRAVVQK